MMKFIHTLLLAIVSLQVQCEEVTYNPLLSAAIDYISKLKPDYVHLIYDNVNNELASELVKAAHTFFISIKLENHFENLVEQNVITRSNKFVIILINNCENLNDNAVKILNSKTFYLIIVQQANSNEIQQLLNNLWFKQKALNVYTMAINDNKSVQLLTFNPFIGDTLIMNINQFLNNSWKNNFFLREKLRNFHRYSVKIATSEFAPAVYRHDGKLKGIDIEILNAIGTSINATIEIDFKLNNFGFVNESISTGAIGKAVRGEVDLIMGFYVLSKARVEFLDYSQPYIQLPTVIVHPRAAPLTPLQKLFQPFQLLPWILFGCISIIGCAILSLLRYFFDIQNSNPEIVRSFMSVIEILVGSSQTLLPKQNFSRIILMTFVMFSLILRTLYQGSLYTFLQSDGRSKEFETIDELIDNGYTIYMFSAFEQMTRGLRLHQR